MIDESLFKSNQLGRDGFTWWIGRVAHSKVWKNQAKEDGNRGDGLQRVKVRIIGYHPWDNSLPENDLPWAHILNDPVVGGGTGGIGETLALKGGETAMGFFLDGEEAQQPVIMGVFDRPASVTTSIKEDDLIANDTNGFEVFTGHPDNDVPAHTIDAFHTKLNETGTVARNKDGNPGGANANTAFEATTTKYTTMDDPCRKNSIGKITLALQNFIAYTQMLEQNAGKWVNPITNEIVNMKHQLTKLKKQVSGILKGIINRVKKKVIGKLTKIFGDFLGLLKITPAGVTAFINDSILQKGLKGIVALIYCVFQKVIGNIGSFIFNMFQNLLGRLINGPLCAAEQFVSGLLAKVFDKLEGLLSPILKGLQWLTGGLGKVQGFLRNVSSLASAIYSFIGCDEFKCTKPSQWISSVNGVIPKPPDNWEKQVKSMNVFTGISSSLTNIGKNLEDAISGIGGEDEETVLNKDFNGTPVKDLLSSVDKLTGGDSSAKLDKGLGSIESAVATITLFGGKNSIFDACNKKNDNPTDQDDISPAYPGYVYPKCIPPKVEVTGEGTGADLKIIVGNDSRIFSIEVLNGGSGYTDNVSISIIDNTGHGSGVNARAIIDDNGTITQVVLLDRGYGYCSDTVGLTTSVVGIVTSIYIVRPGIGFTGGDTIGIGNSNFPITITPGGSIVDVTVPFIPDQFGTAPGIKINSDTGFGAEFIPVMSYKDLSNTDDGADARRKKPLIGITSVIDCP